MKWHFLRAPNAKWRALRQSLEIPSGQLAVWRAADRLAFQRLNTRFVISLSTPR
jgi:hypothetical protein